MTQPSSPLPFETSEPNARKWTDAAYEALATGTLKGKLERHDGVLVSHVTGRCPRCEHLITDNQVLTIVAEGIRRGVDAPPPSDYVPVTVTCDCGRDHPRRPPGGHGCGITFRLELRQPK